MHMHREPLTMQTSPMEGDVVRQVLSFLELAAHDLQALGIQKSRIVVDPGIGFGKTVAQNFVLLARQGEMLRCGFPVLVGWSRKSSLASTDVHLRLVASVAAALLAAERGASIIRVHDVRETVQALKVLSAIR
jgi:dihydropteroate synthase